MGSAEGAAATAPAVRRASTGLGRGPGRWALLTWERYMARHFEAPQQLWCSAWAPAGAVQRVEHEDYTQVPRLQLDGDQRWWPTPPGPKLGHYEVLRADSELAPPDGFRWCSPRFSKRR